jgi:hypothetical protein
MFLREFPHAAADKHATLFGHALRQSFVLKCSSRLETSAKNRQTTATLEVAEYNSTRRVDDDALGQMEPCRGTVVVEGFVAKISPKISTQILRCIGVQAQHWLCTDPIQQLLQPRLE